MSGAKGEDFGGPEWRRKRASDLIQRAQEAREKGDIARSLELLADALEQLPLQRYSKWPGAREPLKARLDAAFAQLARLGQ